MGKLGEAGGGDWVFTAHAIATAGDDPEHTNEVAADDWFAGVLACTRHVLETIRVEPTADEWRSLEDRPTQEFAAFRLVSRARFLHEEKMAPTLTTPLLREALQIDPAYGDAANGLAASLWRQGEKLEAEKLLRELLADDPRHSSARLALGFVRLFGFQDPAGAEEAFREAIRVDPEFADAYKGLGIVLDGLERRDEAIQALHEALLLNPFDPLTHALLGEVHIAQQDREAAKLSLLEAERFLDANPDAELRLGMAYGRLSDYSRAAHHLERALAILRKTEADAEALEEIGILLKTVQERLAPTYVQASRPQAFSTDELGRELARRLTAEEMALAVNPFTVNEEMAAWARQLTEGAASDLDRARRLYDWLVHRVRGRGKGGSRTAMEVFETWGDLENTFSCQEYGKLFVGLGRAVGLDTYYVHLERDYDDKIVYHDCAALFLEDRALLVDPAYHWFGVPHRHFEILDDLETIAHHAFQSRDKESWVSRCRLALKLDPDHAWGRIVAANAFFQAGDYAAVEAHLARAGELEPDRWDAFVLRGRLAGQRQQIKLALEYLERARELNPENCQVQFFLGTALLVLGQHAEAAEAFRAALRYDDGYSDEIIAAARESLAEANELGALAGGDEAALAAIEKRAAGGKLEAQISLALHYLEGGEPEIDEARKWLELAAAQDSAPAQFELGRIQYFETGGERDIESALRWLHRSADNGDRDASFLLAVHYWQQIEDEGDESREEWRKFAHQSAERGHPEGQFRLGMNYYEGNGVGRDVFQAHHWLSRARASGHPKAGQLVEEIEQFNREELERARSSTVREPSSRCP